VFEATHGLSIRATQKNCWLLNLLRSRVAIMSQRPNADSHASNCEDQKNFEVMAADGFAAD
jgi:hypothetical protein